ncbi:MAG TPA: RdgB/HAM1 family non-canonical purine NTP pyrophosphatase [Acidimicrobiales bacterium]|nr:RdgB/HAM1 family non-canonical purine NTP pyrophosphatase [Acidimicrobiales bacterium]
MSSHGQKIRIVMASANPDKAAEIVSIVAKIAGQKVEIVPRPDVAGDVEETGDTLEENARIKARALVEATGLAAIADDTGLEVEALGGAPGVRSSRYSGEDATYEENVAKLLCELKEAGAVTPDQRRARFRTVALALFPDGFELLANGVTSGTISEEPRGEGGFGYDPVFVPDGVGGSTYAEMSRVTKNACSHRGKAFRAIAIGLVRLTDS